MPKAKPTDDNFGDREAKRRFEAALRGSRNVGPRPMKSMTPKRGDTQRKDDTNSRTKK